MSKKPKNEKRLAEIAAMAGALSNSYPQLAKQYQKGRERRDRLWQLARLRPADTQIQQEFTQEQGYHDGRVDACDEYQRNLRRLGELAAVHLPELDGTLQHVRFYAKAWHDKPLDEWEPLLKELGRVEAAALRVVAELKTESTPVNKPKRGRRAMTREELEAKLEEADLLGTAAYCEKYGCVESTISKWRSKLREMDSKMK